MTDLPPFGRWLRQLRNGLDLTQDALAEQVGCATQTIRKLESGERRPSAFMAERLAQILEVDPAQRAAFLKAARTPVVKTAPEAVAEPETMAPPVVRAQLPVYATGFVGRGAELHALQQLLEARDCRLVTIVGPGGVGKTRLAVEAAGHFTSFADGAVFVPLAALESETLALAAIADALGFKIGGADDAAEKVLAQLQDKELLLVLDNFEQLASRAGLLELFTTRAPGVSLLVTSRERLHLADEWVVELDGLTVGDGEAMSDAVALFNERARRVRHDWAPTRDEQRDVERVCSMLDGSPLGIELAAGWLRLLSVAELTEQIASGLDFLEASVRGVPDRHRSLRAVFEHSWQLLSPDEQRALRRLSVFRGGFDRQAAAMVAEAPLHILAALVDKSLLRRAGAVGGAMRFELHEAVRQYAALRLDGDEGERADVRDRHARHYALVLQGRETSLKSYHAVAAAEELRLELDNIRMAAEWSVERGMLDALAAGRVALAMFYETRNTFSEGETVFGRGVAGLERHAQQNPERAAEFRAAAAVMLAQQGYFAARAGQFDRARSMSERAINELRGSGDAAGLVDALIGFGIACFQKGDFGDARTALHEGVELARSTGDEWNTAFGLMLLGNLLQTVGEFDAGRPLLREALVLWRRLGHPRGLSMCLDFMSLDMLRSGAPDEAEAYLHESLELCASADDRLSFGIALEHLSAVALARGNVDEARYALDECLSLYHEVGSRWNVARALNLLGNVAARLGRGDEARERYTGALATALQGRALPEAMNALAGIAELAASGGETARALELAAYVLQHPSAGALSRVNAQRVLATLGVAADDERVAASIDRARSMPVETVAEALIPRHVERRVAAVGMA